MRADLHASLERLGSAVADGLAPHLPDSLAWLVAEPVALGALVAVLGLGAVAVVATAAGRHLRRRWRIRRDVTRSRARHERAQEREPPVEVGDVATAGVLEFSTHHSGERHAVCKVEGFVCFVAGVPDDLEAGDVVRFTVTSFNRGRTSASATFVERV